ncbi:Eukaryotic translation initiation factor 2C, partial [Rhizophlyctis rosea]
MSSLDLRARGGLVRGAGDIVADSEGRTRGVGASGAQDWKVGASSSGGGHGHGHGHDWRSTAPSGANNSQNWRSGASGAGGYPNDPDALNTWGRPLPAAPWGSAGVDGGLRDRTDVSGGMGSRTGLSGRGTGMAGARSSGWEARGGSNSWHGAYARDRNAELSGGASWEDPSRRTSNWEGSARTDSGGDNGWGKGPANPRGWSVYDAPPRDDVPRYQAEGGRADRDIWRNKLGYHQQRDEGIRGSSDGWADRGNLRTPHDSARSTAYRLDADSSYYSASRDDFYSRASASPTSPYTSRIPIGANRPRFVTPTLPAYREHFVDTEEIEPSGFGKGDSPRSESPEVDVGVEQNDAVEKFVRPARPGHGVVGRKIRLLSNHFGVQLPDRDVYHYVVEFEPKAPSALTRMLFEAWIKLPRSPTAARVVELTVFDGRESLYSPEPLPEAEVGAEHAVKVVEDGEQHSQKFTVRLIPNPAIPMSVLHAFINRTDSATPYPEQQLQVLEVLLRHRPASLYVTIGKKSSSFFSAKDQAVISGGLSVYRGWYQSVRPTWRSVLLNLDTSATSFYRSGPLLDVISEFFGARRITDIPKLQFMQSLHQLSRFLRGVKIDTTYRGTHGRTKYKIEAISDKSADQARILIPDQPPMSITEYFKERYGIVLEYGYLPCAVFGKGRRVMIPVELCRIREGQRYLGRLNEFQLADMIKITSERPEGRWGRVEEGMCGLHQRADTTTLQKWGINVNPQLRILTGRVLPPTPLKFHRQVHTSTDGTWKFTSNLSFARPAPPLVSWSVVVFASSRDVTPERIQNFVRSLVRAMEEKGLAVGEKCPDIVYARGSIKESLEEGQER